MAAECEHEFHCKVDVHCWADRTPLGMLEITASCSKCPAVIEFIGLECGVNMAGASCSPDQREARLAISVTTEPAEIKHARMKVRMN